LVNDTRSGWNYAVIEAEPAGAQARAANALRLQAAQRTVAERASLRSKGDRPLRETGVRVGTALLSRRCISTNKIRDLRC
jgi:hypothetical protein